MKSINTGNAWNKLYLRLEKEQLLPQAEAARTTTRTWQWAAAAIAVCCITALSVYILSTSPQKEKQLSVRNSDAAQILVTTLNDGSTVFLDRHASLSYPEHFAQNQRIVRMEGNALFNIAKDLQRPFIIDTKYAIIEVLGTSFDIHAPEEQASFLLSVKTGRVKVTGKNHSGYVFAEAGETVSFETNHLQKRATGDHTLFDRYVEKMSFKDETLEQLLQVIEYTTGHTFILEKKDLARRKLTVAFENNNANEMTELICLALQLKYEQRNDTTYIFSK